MEENIITLQTLILCQLLPINRRARFEFSVLCPEICLYLANCLDSKSAPTMPTYTFPNLRTILAESDSFNILCENRPRGFRTIGKYSHSRVTVSVNFNALSMSLPNAKPDLSCKPKTRVRKSRYWGEMLLSPNHCCDVTKPPYLPSGELSTSPLHSNRLFVYTVCCRRRGQCFSVLRTCHTDVVGDSSGRSYVTDQWHNVPILRTRDLRRGDMVLYHNSV